MFVAYILAVVLVAWLSLLQKRQNNLIRVVMVLHGEPVSRDQSHDLPGDPKGDLAHMPSCQVQDSIIHKGKSGEGQSRGVM